MKRETFNQYIKKASWRGLFITEMGWNAPHGQNLLPTITVDDTDYNFTVVAQRNGFQILSCEVNSVPNMSTCRKIDLRLRRQANDYIAIYAVPQTEHHLWACPLKRNEKRDIVVVEYTTASQADFLFSKMEAITFALDAQTTIIDVRQQVGKAFALNAEKITLNFYTGFRKQHKQFASFITGIDDELPLYNGKKQELNRNKLWYASVMLNRLMFCYFIQKKGFLDGDVNYLNNRLQQVQAEEGKDQFYNSFYRDFLVSLFHDGLNAPRHTPEWQHRFGHIPYLNGGMFDVHKLEREYPDINISDEAFTSLFAFFDTWQWHLDTRITATGKDINPDVLGYIFEQYINDRAAMGAYYTKEDITEYISKNCILPWLFDRVAESSARDAFRPEGEVWQHLHESGDRYIYDAIKRGYTADWREHIPADIACGLDTSAPELLQRRKLWNRPTPESLALPTEIWRETIARWQRCDQLIDQIASGEIVHINDFITLNLDIRSFAYNLLAGTADRKLVANFYHALQSVTILDPTCGSGAFLFAALGILEPLYEVCILRMQEWNEQNPNWFKDELGEIHSKYRSNIQYFIYKSIILRNLYGVDIMVEATEIAKLRLFLKMVAVVEVDRRADNMGLDPLPDVDFNIRCGNTLVGYATEKQIEADLAEGDVFAAKEFRDKIEERMRVVASAYKLFRHVQLMGEDDREEYVKAKNELRQELLQLNDLLSRHLFKKRGGDDYEAYLSSYQPFHWIAEFYHIIKGNGGFDVVIGNPPYVEHSSKDINYSLSHLISANCGNLYGNCIERSLTISSGKGKFSFIIPVAITCSKRMDKVIELLKKKAELIFCSNFDDRPGKLFEMIEHLRATIIISSFKEMNDERPVVFSTKYNRWYTENRNILFKCLCYTNVTEFVHSYVIPKFSLDIECSINRKTQKQSCTISELTTQLAFSKVYYRAAGGGYFLLIKNQKSITYINGALEDVKAEKMVSIKREYSNTAMGALLSSTLFYWNYIAYTDCRNLTKAFIVSFKLQRDLCQDALLIKCGEELFEDYEQNKRTKNTTFKTTGRNVVYDEYYPKLSKPIIDEIDKVLAKHYGFSEEELDFIINYDIKYRMGEELNNNETN